MEALVTLQDGDGIVALDGRSRGDQNLDTGTSWKSPMSGTSTSTGFAHVASPCLITRGLDRLFRDQSPACAVAALTSTRNVPSSASAFECRQRDETPSTSKKWRRGTAPIAATKPVRAHTT